MSSLEGELASSTQSIVLDLPPSCIEFCPAHPHFFVVGTYNLEKAEEESQNGAGLDDDDDDGDDGETHESSTGAATQPQPQSRNGSIIVFQLKDGKVSPVETVPQPSAVFDVHFSPHPGSGDICAAVSSTGTISFFRLRVAATQQDTTDPRSLLPGDPAAPAPAVLEPLSVLTVPDLDDHVLFTYFAWHPTVPGTIAIATAGGDVILVQLDDRYQDLDVLANPILQHSLEAWVVAFTTPHPKNPTTTILSGGDDSILQYTTCAPSSSSPSLITRLPSRHHSAGVTAILPLPPRTSSSSSSSDTSSHPATILTGSYDDTLRLFRLAPPSAPTTAALLLAERNLGGGVWRLSLLGGGGGGGSLEVNDDDDNSHVAVGRRWGVHVLASCMHAGARVLRIAGGRGSAATAADQDEADVVTIEVVARFEEHRSMNYASDWSRVESRVPATRGGGAGKVVCVSTSFYDRLLCVWSARLPGVIV